MPKHKKNTQFVSDIDLFAAEFDKTHAPSASQLAEKRKYQAIYQLRDIPQSEPDEQQNQ